MQVIPPRRFLTFFSNYAQFTVKELPTNCGYTKIARVRVYSSSWYFKFSNGVPYSLQYWRATFFKIPKQSWYKCFLEDSIAGLQSKTQYFQHYPKSLKGSISSHSGPVPTIIRAATAWLTNLCKYTLHRSYNLNAVVNLRYTNITYYLQPLE